MLNVEFRAVFGYLCYLCISVPPCLCERNIWMAGVGTKPEKLLTLSGDLQSPLAAIGDTRVTNPLRAVFLRLLIGHVSHGLQTRSDLFF